MKFIGFALCLENENYQAALELRKLYPIVEPEPNDPPDYLRIVDESGEDYLYPVESFAVVGFSEAIERRLAQTLS
jgi:hypothetical protein